MPFWKRDRASRRNASADVPDDPEGWLSDTPELVPPDEPSDDPPPEEGPVVPPDDPPLSDGPVAGPVSGVKGS
jgi:hypothetical protein